MTRQIPYRYLGEREKRRGKKKDFHSMKREPFHFDERKEKVGALLSLSPNTVCIRLYLFVVRISCLPTVFSLLYLSSSKYICGEDDESMVRACRILLWWAENLRNIYIYIQDYDYTFTFPSFHISRNYVYSQLLRRKLKGEKKGRIDSSKLFCSTCHIYSCLYSLRYFFFKGNDKKKSFVFLHFYL